MVRRWFWAILLGVVLLLAACVPASSSGIGAANDPSALRATAQAYNQIAEAYNSQAAQAEMNRQATEQAYHALATQTAQAYQSTAQYIGLVATQRAVDATATAEAMRLAMQSYQATATVQALERKAEEERRAAEIEHQKIMIQTIIETVVVFLALAAVIAIFIVFMYRMLDSYIHWQETRRSIMMSPVGVLVVRRDGMPPIHVDVLKPRLESGKKDDEQTDDIGDDDVRDSDVDWIPYRVGDNVVGYVRADWRRTPVDPQRRLALRLLRESIRVAGPQSNRIPGWRDLGWSAETWSRAVGLLWRYVKTQPGQGTFLVGEYPTVESLYNAVGSRQISLSPAPTEVE